MEVSPEMDAWLLPAGLPRPQAELLHARPSSAPDTIAAVDMRREPIVIETVRYRIEGMLTLPREGYRSRLSDFVNQRDRDFFSISDATVTVLDSTDAPWNVGFVMVARSQIVLVRPGEGRAEDVAG